MHHRIRLIITVSIAITIRMPMVNGQSTFDLVDEHSSEAEHLVQQLQASSQRQREEATKQLIQLGQAAIPAIISGMRKNDVETSFQGVTILREMCWSPDDETWRQAQQALRELAESPNKIARRSAREVLRDQPRCAEDQLVRMGCKPIGGRPTLTINPDWSGGQYGLLALRWLPHVKTIRIVRAEWHPEALANLRFAEQLQALVLLNVAVDDRIFDHLVHVPGLETLYINGASISDEGLRKLGGRETLLWLELQNTPITDASIDSLSTLKKLRGLRIAGTKISAKGAEQLHASLPQARIFSDHEP